jgi:aryl-alcohol dehydrogenase-like predicted oxidoreductase
MRFADEYRWDFATSVEEVMLHLHSYVMSKQVLYLGVSDTPAWVVVKANECKHTPIATALPFINGSFGSVARKNGLTPFSIYQGRWNAAFRDMEAEIIPMCEDQGMAVVPWAALGGGLLLSAEQRRQREESLAGQKSYYNVGPREIAISDALEKIAVSKGTNVQAIVSPDSSSFCHFLQVLY